MGMGTIWIMAGILLMLTGIVVFVIAQLLINDRIRNLKDPTEEIGRSDLR
ncbi:MAG: hypothetical protein IKE52_07465 [Mogibacterium sp.]|nr:hypothetical protein [Mogibacterium sp.]